MGGLHHLIPAFRRTSLHWSAFHLLKASRKWLTLAPVVISSNVEVLEILVWIIDHENEFPSFLHPQSLWNRLEFFHFHHWKEPCEECGKWLFFLKSCNVAVEPKWHHTAFWILPPHLWQNCNNDAPCLKLAFVYLFSPSTVIQLLKHPKTNV